MRESALQVLLVLCCLLPLAVLAIAGWRSWQFEHAETMERANATLGIVEEHVRKLFDTQLLVLDWLRDRVEGMSWRDIERSEPLYKLMAFLDELEGGQLSGFCFWHDLDIAAGPLLRRCQGDSGHRARRSDVTICEYAAQAHPDCRIRRNPGPTAAAACRLIAGCRRKAWAVARR